MLIRIHKDWNYPNILRQTPKGMGFWGSHEFTTEEVNDFDLLIVLNRPAKDLTIKCRKGGNWLMSQESPIDLYKWHTRSFNYFDKIFTFWDNSYSSNIIHTQTSLPWHIGKTFDELVNLPQNEKNIKQEKISWVTSNATNKQGHRLRMQFKDALKKQDFPFDLFGRGFHPIDDKFDAIYPYKYSIAIENYACDDYWTEKIADCFLSWTMPIYYGCSNITSYFPKESMLIIDPTKPEDAIQKINDAIKNNLWQKNLPYIKQARELILNEYQLFPSIVKKIEQYKISKKQKKSWYFIPVNHQNVDENFRKKVHNNKQVIKTILKNLLNV